MMAIFAPLVATYGFDEQNYDAIREKSSLQHLCGTDNLRRNIFSRLAYGARVSLSIGLISVGIGLALGGFIGAVAGYYGGKLACAIAGIISGVIMGSGLGFRISAILVSVAGQSTFLLLVLTMLVSLIMGMGVPTTAAYLVLAALVAPTLIKLGAHALAIHMFIFYFGCVSSITPPVALAAYAAAGLAGCDPNKTGFKAFRLAICAFIMPFMFVYNPVLLMEGSIFEILQSSFTALLGAYMLCSGFEAYFINRPVRLLERIVLLSGAFLLIIPEIITDLIGIGIFTAIVLTGYLSKNKANKTPAAS